MGLSIQADGFTHQALHFGHGFTQADKDRATNNGVANV
jgi:hypothetical protein